MRKHCILVLFTFSLVTIVAQDKKVTLIFAGDAMQHLPQVYAAKTDSGYKYNSVFELVKDKITQADIAGVNFETTLGGKPYTGYPLFSSPNEYAAALKNAGFNLFFTANNHALDTGKEGLEETIRAIKYTGAKQTGTFVSKEDRNLHYPLMIIKNDIRIAFLNYTYGTNGLLVQEPNIVNLIDTVLIKEDIVSAKLLKPDIIIAVMHWGEEYHTTPSINQKSIAEFLHNNNVPIIIGHHPHVIQPLMVNRDNDRITQVIYYSLGNFISNQRQPNTDGGMLAEIELRKESDNSVTIEYANYSLVWVHKYFDGRKPVYRILPVEADTTGYHLKHYEQWTMDRFVKGAER